MNEKITFNVDQEILKWLQEIKEYYRTKNGIKLSNRSDLLRTIIMREWFRVTGKM